MCITTYSYFFFSLKNKNTNIALKSLWIEKGMEMEKICNVADSEYSEKHLFISYYAFLKMLPLDFSVGVNKLLGIINS